MSISYKYNCTDAKPVALQISRRTESQITLVSSYLIKHLDVFQIKTVDIEISCTNLLYDELFFTK